MIAATLLASALCAAVLLFVAFPTNALALVAVTAIVLGVAAFAGWLHFRRHAAKIRRTGDYPAVRFDRGVSALLILFSLSGCAASPTVVAATATSTIVRTVDEGVDVFTAWAVVEEKSIADAVVKACPTRDKACEAPILARRVPIDKVTVAIKAWRGAVAVGGDASSGDLARAGGDLVAALATVGVKVQP